MSDFTARLRELLEKATPGPWREATDAQGTCGLLHPDRHGVAVAWFSDGHKPVEGYVGDGIGMPDRQANVDLIRILVNNAPALLKVVEAAEYLKQHDDEWPKDFNRMPAYIKGHHQELFEALRQLQEPPPEKARNA